MWEPLVIVADLAGGAWPARARAAAAAMTADSDADEAESPHRQLLSDIRDVFENLPGIEFVGSTLLCARLNALDDSPWQHAGPKRDGLTPHALAKMVANYGVKAEYKNSYRKERGYQVANFSDAFDRWLPPTTGEVSAESTETTEKQPLPAQTVSVSTVPTTTDATTEQGADLARVSVSVVASVVPDMPNTDTETAVQATNPGSSVVSADSPCSWCEGAGLSPRCPECGKIASIT